MNHSMMIICIIISLDILICGCTSENSLVSNNLESNKFVAITLIVRSSGTVVSGKIPMTEGAQPLPAFFDSPEQYKPSNYPADYPPKNDSLKILIGIINIEDSPLHLTANLNNVIGIYNLPYTLEPGFTIIGVDKNGTVEMYYNNESINLTPRIFDGKESNYSRQGTAWKSPVISTRNETKTITFPAIGGTNYTFTINYNRTYEIDNKGVFIK